MRPKPSTRVPRPVTTIGSATSGGLERQARAGLCYGATTLTLTQLALAEAVVSVGEVAILSTSGGSGKATSRWHWQGIRMTYGVWFSPHALLMLICQHGSHSKVEAKCPSFQRLTCLFGICSPLSGLITRRMFRARFRCVPTVAHGSTPIKTSGTAGTPRPCLNTLSKSRS